MGHVKDVYLRYLESGDQFCGRILCLLPLLNVEFASSPPFFKDEWLGWAATKVHLQFSAFRNIPHLSKFLTMCLASMVKHYGFLVDDLFGKLPNHVL